MSFASLYAHGFARVAACTADVYVADPARNAASVIEVSRRLSAEGVAVAVFPELSLTGYAVDDLLGQDALLDAVQVGLAAIVEASADLLPVIIVGAPLRHRARLFNTAVVIHRGRVLGVVPKIHLPTYREFYERRQFASGHGIVGRGDRRRRPAGAVRHRPAVRGHRRTRADGRGGDLRGHVRPGAAVERAGAGRGDGAGQPVRQPDHHRPGGHPQRAVPHAVDAVPGRLPVRGGRPGRVDHRPVLGRPDQHLRERRPARPGRALRGGSAADHRRRRPRPAPAGAGPAGHLRGQPAGGDPRRALPDGATSPSTRPTTISACAGSSSGSPSCRPIPTGWPRTATRRTTSRSTGWRSGCGPSTPRRW